MNNGSIKAVAGKVLSSKRPVDDWDPDECLCAGKVADDKRIDVQNRILDERKGKHVWKSFVRYHQDCPIHGCNLRSE